MQPSEQKTENLAIPGESMSQEVFLKLIKEAEEGEFLSAEEFKEQFNNWRNERKKL